MAQKADRRPSHYFAIWPRQRGACYIPRKPKNTILVQKKKVSEGVFEQSLQYLMAKGILEGYRYEPQSFKFSHTYKDHNSLVQVGGFRPDFELSFHDCIVYLEITTGRKGSYLNRKITQVVLLAEQFLTEWNYEKEKPNKKRKHVRLIVVPDFNLLANSAYVLRELALSLTGCIPLDLIYNITSLTERVPDFLEQWDSGYIVDAA